MSGAWKVAYADFVTAMMAFFLLLWILGMAPEETKVGLAAYFSGERNFDANSVSPISNNPFVQNTDKIDMRDLKISEKEETQYAIAQRLTKMLMANAVPQSASGVSSDDVGVQLRVNSDLLFEKGTAKISKKAEILFKEVVAILKEYNLYLMVRGHASADEIKPPYPSEWELSGARAAAVIRHIIEEGDIKPTRMRGIAYGNTRPVKPEVDAESKKYNRRVEFYFHRPEVMSNSVVY